MYKLCKQKQSRFPIIRPIRLSLKGRKHTHTETVELCYNSRTCITLLAEIDVLCLCIHAIKCLSYAPAVKLTVSWNSQSYKFIRSICHFHVQRRQIAF